MKVKVLMQFEGSKHNSQETYEAVFDTKDGLFSAAHRINVILTTMLENGIVAMLGTNFVDRKNEKDESPNLSSDVISAVASPYNFRG